MKLRFAHFDGRKHNTVPVIDQDTGKEVGYVRSQPNGPYGYGLAGISVSLFDDKYSADVNSYEERLGFVRGVSSVLNQITYIQEPAAKAVAS